MTNEELLDALISLVDDGSGRPPLEMARDRLARPEAARTADLASKIRAMPRYDCSGPEGDYDAGMVSGDGYVDAYDLENLLKEAEASPQVDR